MLDDGVPLRSPSGSSSSDAIFLSSLTAPSLRARSPLAQCHPSGALRRDRGGHSPQKGGEFEEEGLGERASHSEFCEEQAKRAHRKK